MTIASLANETGALAPAFNADFYATTAGVIPVLFLALTIQGDLYGRLLANATRATRSFASGRRVPLAGVAAFIGPVTLAILILILGAISEIEAVAALALQHAEAATRDTVLAGTISLTVIVAATPAGRVARLVYRAQRVAATGPQTAEQILTELPDTNQAAT